MFRAHWEHLLNPIPKGDVPLDTLHVDHVGPIPSTAKNYQNLLVIVDAFTKFTWLFATKTRNAAEVVKNLSILEAVFGNPKRIISDKGGAFVSNEFHDYCKERDIQHLLITTGVPRANGQVERVNKIVETAFRKISGEEPLKWYKHVNRVQQALNATYQRSIGSSPFELLIGTKMRCRDDPKLKEYLEGEWRELFSEQRDELRSKAKERIQKAQKENKRTYNKKRVPATKYSEGDIVAISRTQFGTGLKVHRKNLGPYRVTRVMRNDRYGVSKIEGEGPNETSTSADYMSPWEGFTRDHADDDNYRIGK